MPLYQITRPSRSRRISRNLRESPLQRLMVRLPFVQPLRHRLRDATSPSRGGFGIAENFSSSPEAPLQGELSAKQTERLYEGQPNREPQRGKPLRHRLRDATSPTEGRPWQSTQSERFRQRKPLFQPETCVNRPKTCANGRCSCGGRRVIMDVSKTPQ